MSGKKTVGDYTSGDLRVINKHSSQLGSMATDKTGAFVATEEEEVIAMGVGTRQK